MEVGDESLLLSRLKEGDIKALEKLFNRHYSGLYKYLLLIFKNQLLVENIAQDVFVYLWENRKTIEVITSLEGYLYSAARYKAINQFRNAKRHQEIERDLAVSEIDICDSPASILELKEQERIIEEAISALPFRCQQIFRLSREEEMSYKQIAQALNISINTVETQMAVALKKLRSTLYPLYTSLLLFF